MRIARVAVACLLATTLVSAQEKAAKFEITKDVQAQLDTWKKSVATWAADGKLTAAVVEQNKKGPIEGLDNKKWKTLRRRSPEVDVFTTNDAAKQLAALAKATDGVVSEAFLNAKAGQKVAFLEKTSSYLHAGSAKHDVPLQKLTAWQGEAEFDESSQTYAVQIAVPVLDPADAKKAIGVLVVGLNLTRMTAAKPAPAK
jgi:hypothetical protein